MLSYIKSIFSSDSAASFSRYATACTIATGIFSVLKVVIGTHALPDGGALAGMGAFMVAPYAVGKAAAAFVDKDATQPAAQEPPCTHS
jgi:hypothetical protein